MADAGHTDILSPQPGNTMVTFVSQMRKLRGSGKSYDMPKIMQLGHGRAKTQTPIHVVFL